MTWILRINMKTNQAPYPTGHSPFCAGEAHTDFDVDPEIHHLATRKMESPAADETVLIEDLIDALHEKERMIEELKHYQTAGSSASVLAAWRRRFAALVISSARPTVDR